MDEVERALLGWYLYAYGNECSHESTKVKCELLALMNISNECDSEYREMLNNYLAFNKIIAFKLKKCPVLPIDGPIQNTIESLSMCRNADLISITIKAKGLNNAQEKHWDIEQTETFRIAGDKLKIEYGNDCCK